MPVPMIDADLRDRIELEPVPDKTFYIDFDKNIISGQIDGRESIAQAVKMIINTETHKYEIYSNDYGMTPVFGVDKTIFEMELRNNIREALLFDDRIEDVEFVETRKTDDNSYFVHILVKLGNGEMIDAEEEVTVNIDE